MGQTAAGCPGLHPVINTLRLQDDAGEGAREEIRMWTLAVPFAFVQPVSPWNALSHWPGKCKTPVKSPLPWEGLPALSGSPVEQHLAAASYFWFTHWVWPGTDYLTTWSLSILICKMGIITVSTSWTCCKIININT